MREIKFRAYHYDTNVMQTNETIFINNGKLVTGRIDVDKGRNINSIFPDSLQYMEGNYEIMQYTGFKDKNGTEIYEGDIVTSELISEKEYFVVSIGLHMMDVNNGEYNVTYYGVGFENPYVTDWVQYEDFYWDERYLEVIGNIYENPELLER